MECTSLNGTICNSAQTSLSFTSQLTQQFVSFNVEVVSSAKVEGRGEASVVLSYGDVKIAHPFQLWFIEYGQASEAQYDQEYFAPRCTAAGRYCSSETLLEGRGKRLGPELNTPNSFNNTCVDGNQGTYKVDESIEKIIVRSGDIHEMAGKDMKEGDAVTIEATVFSYGTGAADTADFFYAKDASNPEWIWIKSIKPTQGGLNTLKASYILPGNSTNQAVRVNYR